MTHTILWSLNAICMQLKLYTWSYSLHTFALTTCEHAWQTVFLASKLPTITAQFAPTSNEYQQIFWSRCEVCRPHFQMVFNNTFPPTFLGFSHPLLHLKIAPCAVIARSCSSRGRICTSTNLYNCQTCRHFLAKMPVS